MMLKWNGPLHTRIISVSLGLRLLVILMSSFRTEATNFSVELRLPRYVRHCGSAVLRCEYSVSKELLRKVEWLRGRTKLVQFVKNRNPPFRHYTIVGAVIDKNHSTERQITLRELDLDASGYYSCEVSTKTPIFTKASNEEELTVIKPQRSAPEVSVRKPLYAVGEQLEANCSSSPAHPVPHVTWLLNGGTVPENFMRFIPNQQFVDGENLSSAMVQLSIPVDHSQVGEDGHLQLACVSTIPAFLNPEADPHEYADYQIQKASVEVTLPKSPSDQIQVIPSIQTLLFGFLIAILGIRNCVGWR